MINRTAALALPLKATFMLVTLNDSATHRFTRRTEDSVYGEPGDLKLSMKIEGRVSVKDKIVRRKTQCKSALSS